MRKLVLETTAPFQGLPELVAYNEGLFEKEGLSIEWADRGYAADSELAIDPGDRLGVNPFGSHGRLLEQGKADMYNACEWGNYCRVGETGTESRQMGRRAIVTYAAVVVRPTSEVYTAQQLAGRSVGVPFYAGTHYLALHLLSGFLNRDLINIVPSPTGSRHRLDAMLSGAVEATTLTEPYISLAEKKGCRSVCAGFYHGTEVASKNVDAETYSRFNAAVKEAVRRINSDKRKYMSYFINYHKERDSELLSLSIDDLRPERLVVCDPAPIPGDELQRTYDWIKSWGMLADIGSPLQLVDTTA